MDLSVAENIYLGSLPMKHGVVDWKQSIRMRNRTGKAWMRGGSEAPEAEIADCPATAP